MKRSAWMVLAMAGAIGACSGGKGGQEAAFIEVPQGEWSELVGQLTDAKDLDEAVAATREILSRGGIATRDGERELVAARPPAASFSVSPGQVEHMAMEARARGVRARLEVAEFAHMLASFGWEFPNARSNGDAARPDPGIEDGYTRERRNELQRDRAQARESARKAEEDSYKAWQASLTDAPDRKSVV